jgi:hypothetical protein
MYPFGLGCGPVAGCCKYSDELLDCGITDLLVMTV